MKKTFLLLMLFTHTFFAGFSQHQTMKTAIEQIICQRKATIIQMAFVIIEEKLPSLVILPEDYEISVWTNGKEVEVRFKRLIRYKQEGIDYRYDLSVEVLNKQISPFDTWGARTNFFVPNQAQKETIAYLTKLMDLPVPGMENEIYEDEEDYHVTFYSKGGHSTYIINKETGEQLAPLDITYVAEPPATNDDLFAPDTLLLDDQPTWEEIE